MVGANVKPAISIIPLSLSDIFPIASFNESEESTYQRAAKDILPGFPDETPFLLMEILELERLDGWAHTFVYSDLSNDDAKTLVREYFLLIDTLSKKRGWSLSAVDNLYFDSQIYCAEILGSTKPRTPLKRQRAWYSSKTRLRRNYRQRNRQESHEVAHFIQEYVEHLANFCELDGTSFLQDFGLSYVLLIPVAFTSQDENFQRKVAALFLHWASTKRLSKSDLLSIYQRALLFWHHHFTSELLGKQILETEIVRREAAKFRDLRETVNGLRQKLEDFHEPMRNLVGLLDPIKGLMFAGRECGRLFQRGRFPLNASLEIETCHGWEEMIAGAWSLSKRQDLTASILINVLGQADRATAPLWQWLVTHLQGRLDKGDEVAKAILNSIPTLSEQSPDDNAVKTVYHTLKLWFDTAYKPKEESGLPYSLLGMTMRQFGHDVSLPSGAERFWVASVPPFHTIDALASLHSQYGIANASLEVDESGRKNVLTLQLSAEPIGEHMGLANSVEATKSLRNQDIRGNSTWFVHLLFSGGAGEYKYDDDAKSWSYKGRRGKCELCVRDRSRLTIVWEGEVAE